MDLTIRLPRPASEDEARRAEAQARQAAIIALQQEGFLTIREAADELGLLYEGYLALLARLRYPIGRGGDDRDLVEQIAQLAWNSRAL